MRKWGIATLLIYMLFLLYFLYPLGSIYKNTDLQSVADLIKVYQLPDFWIFFVIYCLAFLVLTVLPVFYKRDDLKKRGHIRLTVSMAALLQAILIYAIVINITVFIHDDLPFYILAIHPALGRIGVYIGIFILWIGWGMIFYAYCKQQKSNLLSRLIKVIFKSSIAELLVAVPAHIYVTKKDTCTLPVVTFYGIATGLAIFLITFGPGIVFLYQKKIAALKRHKRIA
jgi:hypothetical protein